MNGCTLCWDDFAIGKAKWFHSNLNKLTKITASLWINCKEFLQFFKRIKSKFGLELIIDMKSSKTKKSHTGIIISAARQVVTLGK
jgi:hypothetical protein